MFAEADEREVAQRRYRAPLDQIDALGPCDPIRVPMPRKLSAPAESACHRRDQVFDGAARACFGPDAAEQDDLAARLEHARELVECGLRVRDGSHYVVRDDAVESIDLEIEPLGVKEVAPFNMLKS